MSHDFISKKIWISALVLTCVFLLLVSIWFYYTNQFLIQSEVGEREEQLSMVQVEMVTEAAEQIAAPILEEKPVLQFPCIIKMQDETIGIYLSDGTLYQTLSQCGEKLSVPDRIQLIRGIEVEDEKQLISLCESYHLQ